MQLFSTSFLGLSLQPFSIHNRCPLATSSHSYSSNQKGTKSYYEELGISKNATASEIKKAFINKSKELHPDVNPLDPKLHQAFVKVSAAYNTLSNTTSRRSYDTKLNSHSTTSSSIYSYSTGSPFGSRDNTSQYYRNHNRWHESHKFYQQPVRPIPLKNKYVVAGVLLFMLSGALVHYVVINFRHKKYKAKVEEANRKANLAYAESKERARSNGVRKQLELLMALHAQPTSSNTLQQVGEVSNDSEKNK